MAKKKVTFDLFARIVVPDNIEPEEINRIIHAACSNQGWDYAGGVQEEGSEDESLSLSSILDTDMDF